MAQGYIETKGVVEIFLRELKKLTIKEYVETCDDIKNKKAPKYLVFSKNINDNEIYIKVKIQSHDDKIVVCMSFHFTEYPISKFPYR